MYARQLSDRSNMTLKIEKYTDGDSTTIRLIGRMQTEHLEELEKQIRESGPVLRLDLDEVTGGAFVKRSAHHVPGFKSWSAVSTQESVPGTHKDLLERRRFGGTGPGLDQVFCRVGRIEKSCDKSGGHSRKENLMDNVGEKNKRIVLDAKTLLLEFLAAVTHGQDAGALFAEDGALELPFLHSVGIPWRHRGRQAIRELQNSLAGLYLDLAFKPEDTHVLIDTPEQVFAEYMAHTTAKATGRTLHHMFAARLVAENGLIKLVRESLNVVAAAQALLPGGVKDLPDPEKEIFSLPPDYRT